MRQEKEAALVNLGDDDDADDDDDDNKKSREAATAAAAAAAELKDTEADKFSIPGKRVLDTTPEVGTDSEMECKMDGRSARLIERCLPRSSGGTSPSFPPAPTRTS